MTVCSAMQAKSQHEEANAPGTVRCSNMTDQRLQGAISIARDRRWNILDGDMVLAHLALPLCNNTG